MWPERHECHGIVQTSGTVGEFADRLLVGFELRKDCKEVPRAATGLGMEGE